jgi:hypothetical protein
MKTLTKKKTINLLPEIEQFLQVIPLEYMRDLARDLAWACLISPRRPDALFQLIAEWKATLEEIELAGDELPDILSARQEVQSGIGMTPDELRAYLASEEV